MTRENVLQVPALCLARSGCFVRESSRFPAAVPNNRAPVEKTLVAFPSRAASGERGQGPDLLFLLAPGELLPLSGGCG